MHTLFFPSCFYKKKSPANEPLCGTRIFQHTNKHKQQHTQKKKQTHPNTGAQSTTMQAARQHYDAAKGAQFNGLAFRPLELRPGVVLRNRVVAPPMRQCRAVGTPECREWYAALARGGAGLVVVEAMDATAVAPMPASEGGAAAAASVTVEDARTVAEAITTNGAFPAVQLFFSYCSAPNDLTEERLVLAISRFAEAARIMVQAGFRGIELHGAHGFTLQHFFDPAHNKRTDRFSVPSSVPLALVRAVRDACGPETLIFYRHTPKGDGFGLTESVAFAKELIAASVDVLDISSGVDLSSNRPVPEVPGSDSAPFRNLGVPVIGVGQLCDIDRALDVLTNNKADLIAIGRQLIADPEWPNKMQNQQYSAIKRCVHCNKNCFGFLFTGKQVSCILW
ncbi:NADH:flavin oxidoreductase/NADH oxidase [Pelomyxa schiedti]|nr:NADH:flavin oxidoreductase/NADH oxidase [Pelomyxa schiedti]